MGSLRGQLRGARWGLLLARSLAQEIAGDKARARVLVRALVRELFDEDVEVRKRAADVARRGTELDGRLLQPYADELAGLLETLPVEESRTRWDLGLVGPRGAHTRMQRLRAAPTKSLPAGGGRKAGRGFGGGGVGVFGVAGAAL